MFVKQNKFPCLSIEPEDNDLRQETAAVNIMAEWDEYKYVIKSMFNIYLLSRVNGKILEEILLFLDFQLST